jgi:hypothetical protein
MPSMNVRCKLINSPAAIALVLAVGGCASIDGPSNALIPNKAFNVSRSLTVPLDTVVLAAGVLYLVDPLAPNWSIAQHDLGGHRFQFELTKKRFSYGGDGEAMQVLRRRMEQLARERSYSSYELIEFTTGIESTVPLAQRTSRGVVQFARTRDR